MDECADLGSADWTVVGLFSDDLGAVFTEAHVSAWKYNGIHIIWETNDTQFTSIILPSTLHSSTTLYSKYLTQVKHLIIEQELLLYTLEIINLII